VDAADPLAVAPDKIFQKSAIRCSYRISMQERGVGVREKARGNGREREKREREREREKARER